MTIGRNTVLDVWNVALSAVIGRAVVSDPDEDSREAEVCRQWYPVVRDSVQEAAWWASCRKTATLARLAERTQEDWAQGAPAPFWTYSYALPDDFLRPRYLSVGPPGLTIHPRFSLELYTAPDGEDRVALHTNYAGSPVTLTYTKRNDTPAQWGANQFQATVYVLAASIAMPLVGNEAVANRNFQLASVLIAEAAATAANDSPEPPTDDPEWLRARHDRLVEVVSPYVYPHKPLPNALQ